MSRDVEKADNLRAAGLMVAAMAFFTINDTLVKTLAGALPLGEVIALRGVATSLALGAWAAWRRQLSLPPGRSDRRVIIWRCLGEAAAVASFLTALFHLPIAVATSILQALPLTVALGAAMVFGDPIGVRRLGAIAVGFVGVLVIIRPDSNGIDPFMLLGLAAVAAVTLRDLATRRLSAGVPGLTVAFWGSLAVTMVGVVMGFGETWLWPTPLQVLILIAAAASIMAAYLFSIATVRVGEMSFAAPFRYSGVLWALLAGFLVFGEWPDALTLAGVAVLVASGVFTLYRERKRFGPAGR